MFLIFGLTTKAELLGLVSFVCQVCGNAGPHQLVRERTRFSLFFVPLIPIRTRNAAHCGVCGARTRVPADEMPRVLATGAVAR
jgi:zinc-ribbon family